MAKILHLDKALQVQLPPRLRGRSAVLPATALPKRGRLEVGEQVAGGVDHPLPFSKHFFERVGVDILVTVWEFVHEGKLVELLPLMLASKAIYSRLEKESDLLLQIAKGNFTFIYLVEARGFRSFKDLLLYSNPSSGAELAFNHYAKQQILRNSRLLRKPFFEMRLKVWPRQVFEGEGMCVVKCFVGPKTTERLKGLLTEFEEAHNAIAMKIFLPFRNHYPFAVHDSSLYILSTAPLDFFDSRRSAILATVRIRFTVRNLRYRFSLMAKHFVAVA